jgi:hypothetical protein
MDLRSRPALQSDWDGLERLRGKARITVPIVAD